MKTMEFERIVLKEASEAHLRALHDLQLELDKEQLPEDSPVPFEEYLSEIRTIPSFVEVHRWLAWDEDGSRLLGASGVHLRRRDDNRHLAFVNLWVRPAHRRKGLGSRLLYPAVETAAADGRTVISGWVWEEGPGVEFADATGAKVALHDYHNRATISEIDRGMLEMWIEKAPHRASDYELLFWEGSCPDEWLERFARMYMVMNTAPRSLSREDEVITPEMVSEWEATAAEQKWVPWTYVTVHKPSGEWAGFTRIYPSIYRKEFAYQEDTAVDPAHRNKGLGRWLKAAMMLRVMDLLPEAKWMETFNATSNDAMLSINRAMAFKPLRVFQERELAADDLLGWLKSRV